MPPGRDLLRRMGRTEFVRVDPRNPMIVKVIATAKVDTVVHTAMTAGGHSTMNRKTCQPRVTPKMPRKSGLPPRFCPAAR